MLTTVIGTVKARRRDVVALTGRHIGVAWSAL
jgi:hypothetical protein